MGRSAVAAGRLPVRQFTTRAASISRLTRSRRLHYYSNSNRNSATHGMLNWNKEPLRSNIRAATR